MDWMRLTAAARDLAGTRGQVLKITRQELQKHNKVVRTIASMHGLNTTQDDAWMVLRGKVYNITPYMKFHPGGAFLLRQSDASSLTAHRH